MSRRLVTAIVLAVSLAVSLAVTMIGWPASTSALPPPPDSEADGEATPTSRFEALEPCRLADTRTGTGFRLLDPLTRRVDLGTCDIPGDATAIVATTTVISATTSGWSVGYPAGSARPNAATLNWSRGMTRGNSSTITVGPDFAIDVFRSDGFDSGHLALDVVGAFLPAESATRGRFVPATEAQRVLDTRGERPLPAATSRQIPLPASVPAGVDALAITVTVVSTTGPTFLTAYPAGSERPLASLLNADGAGQVRSAATIVPVNDTGFELYGSATTDVVVDMTGWFTGPAADSSTAGLFVPVPPRRLRDTRLDVEALYAAGTAEVTLPDDFETAAGDGAAAVAVSMTMIGADDRGFVTAHAARAERPSTASGYSGRNEITAQFALSPVSSTGLAIFSEQGTDMTVDVLGWFTGDAVVETEQQPAPNPRRPLRVLAIGDSTMAGIRWYGALGALTGASWTFAGESCRRLVRSSCRGREGRYPPTALQTIEAMPDVFDVAVIMTGYNDRASTFESDLERIMSAARSRGVRRVVWLTYSRELRSDKGGPDAAQVYEFHNTLLRSAGERHHDLTVADWSGIARARPEWVHSDGIHFTNDGSYGNADFMSRAVAYATGRPCPVPYVAGSTAEDTCADPSTVASPDVRSLYDFVDTVTQCWEVGPTRAVECVQDPYTR